MLFAIPPVPSLTLTAKACLDCAVLLLHVISSADHMSDFSVPLQLCSFQFGISVRKCGLCKLRCAMFRIPSVRPTGLVSSQKHAVSPERQLCMVSHAFQSFVRPLQLLF